MTLFQRFKRYLFGVLLGLILVYFFFGDRGEVLTAWMPNERVLKRLRETKLILPDSVQCQLKCFQLDTTAVSTLLDEGDVLFAESDTQSEPKVYRVQFEQRTPPLELTFSCTDSTSTVVDLSAMGAGSDCPCP